VSHPKLFRHLASLALFLALIMSASPVWAWGDLGHRVICQIAFRELNERVRNEVIRLIALDATFDSFTDACTWPDNPRKRAEGHFINVARSVQTITLSQCPGVPKCLFTAIPAVLDNRAVGRKEIAMAASITFTLRNNQMTDVNVTVVDLRTNTKAIDNVPLNVDERVPVNIVAGSDDRGSALWVFASSDGSVNSNKKQDGIRDGDECTLG